MITAEEFDLTIKDNSVVLVDFWAEWCPHCLSMMPHVDAISREMGEKVKVVKVDAGTQAEIVNKFSVRSLPTFMIFKNGELIDQFNGSTTPIELKQKITLATK
jgi:thioredoxin